MQELLRSRHGRPCILVRLAGRDVSHTREPLDSLTNCAKAIVAFERATGFPARPAPAAGRPRRRSFPAHPSGRFHRGPGDLGAALVGQRPHQLCWWPDEGWQRGTVARLFPRGISSHVLADTRQTSALRGQYSS